MQKCKNFVNTLVKFISGKLVNLVPLLSIFLPTKSKIANNQNNRITKSKLHEKQDLL